MNYDTIVVCGGGCYGGYYVRQLARARAAGALHYQRIVVVDRDASCRVAQLIHAIARRDAVGIKSHGWRLRRADDPAAVAADDGCYDGLPITFELGAWVPFFERWFAQAIERDATASSDAVVPSPLMPNLLADWVASRLTAHSGDVTVRRVPVTVAPHTPWSRTGADDSHYASFATWMCPINCIEPPRCPETRAPRDWTMPAAVRDAVGRATELGSPYDVVALFRTTHRAYGVGMFDVTDALAADAAISAARGDARRVLVASVSHCHGAMAELVTQNEPVPH